MRFNLISNINNGFGLQKDFEILKVLLEQLGHSVAGVQFQKPEEAEEADVNIYLETLVDLHGKARENWWIPNAEWFDPRRDGKHIDGLSRILCKTFDAANIFSRCKQTSYIGFESMDLFRENVAKEKRFIHVAGKSIVKNTKAILEAWKNFGIEQELTIVGCHPHIILNSLNRPHITLKQRIKPEELESLLNSHLFNLCPSEYEGWGHCIHEALGVGSVVITTDAPPMNENSIAKSRLIPARPKGMMNRAKTWTVDADAIRAAVSRAISTDDGMLQQESKENRDLFLLNRNAFRKRFEAIIKKTEETMK